MRNASKVVRKIGRDLGINERTLHTWIDKYSQPVVANAKVIRTDEHLYDELKRLKKEVAQLTEERNLLKIGDRVLCQGTTVKYAWIKQHDNEFSAHSICRFMGVSRSAYYGWLQRKPTAHEQVDTQLTPIIQSIFAKSRATYGTRRIRQTLEKQDLPVGRRRIGRLMRAAGLACKTKRKIKATTKDLVKNNFPKTYFMGKPDSSSEEDSHQR